MSAQTRAAAPGPDEHADRVAGPDDERAGLDLGMAALASFQQVTQQADGKANMLLAVHVGLAAVLATQLPQVRRTPTHGAFAVAFWLLSLAYLLGFVMDGYLIAQVIRPRVADCTEGNPLALPRAAAVPWQQGGSPSSTAACASHVWELAQGVAALAAQKNALLTRAVLWTAVMVVSAMAWLTLVSAAG
ncbi:MAG TPA: hypothetical protein VI248_14425 [Kineosporiaceae bacterium]